MEAGPVVSVIVPNYNHARFLPQRITSILEQTYSDFELLLLDDCSTDDSRRVLEQYAAQDSRISTHFSEQNSGSPFAQWSKGVAWARGQYVWIAESDDFAHPSFLETLVPILVQRPSVGLAYCQSHKVDEDGQVVGDGLPRDHPRIDYRRWLEPYQSRGADEVAHYLVFKNIIPNASALLFRRSVFPDSADVADGLRLCGDWLVYLKMLRHCDLYYHPKKLNHFRVHRRTVRAQLDWNGIDVLRERSHVVRYAIEHFEVPQLHQTEAVRPIYFYYLLNLTKLSFLRAGNLKKYRKVRQFLRPFVRDRQLRREVHRALRERLWAKGAAYLKRD